MLRPSRSLTIALLWLAIALLPLRGWAAAVMPAAVMPAAVTPAAVAGQAVADALPADAGIAAQDATTPCHGDDGGSASGNGEHASCSLCEVCHSAAAPMAGAAPARAALPPARPRVDRAPGVERPVQSGPERPPRIERA